MTREELLAYHRALCDRAVGIMVDKNRDYAGQALASADRWAVFGNLRRCETLAIVPTEIGILIRIHDKLSRIQTYLQVGTLAVKDEPVERELVDVINYCGLLGAAIKERNACPETPRPSAGSSPKARKRTTPRKRSRKPASGR